MSCSGGGGGGGGSAPVGGRGGSGVGGGGNNIVIQTVGAAGGNVMVTDPESSLYGTSIYVPPGALPDYTHITISANDDPSIMNGVADGNIVVVFGPDGTVFSTPITISVPYDETNITDENNILIFLYNESTGTWESVSSDSVDTVNNIATVEVSHFSSYMCQEAAYYYTDADGDGFGDENDAGTDYTYDFPGAGWSLTNDDCDDTPGSGTAFNPEVTEMCDGVDNNCDGQTDEGCAAITYYIDADGAGFGDMGDHEGTAFTSDPGEGWSLNNDDCDDSYKTGASNYPGAIEICDGLDNNCNDVEDEGCAVTTYYIDADGDGFGDENDTGTGYTYEPGEDWSLTNDDCDDDDPLEFPGQVWYQDADNDGYSSGVTSIQCDRPQAGYKIESELIMVSGDVGEADNDPTIHPSSPEICADNIDNDNDGDTDEGCYFQVPSDAYETIQDAVDEAPIGATITVSDGIYLENIQITKAVTLKSLNGPEVTWLDGLPTGRVVTFSGTGTMPSVLDGFTITNGKGGVSAQDSSLTITDCIITNNTISYGGGGGGISAGGESAELVVKDCIITNNSSTYHAGGGINLRSSSSATIENCTISNNTAPSAGGIYAYKSSLTITDCTINNNSTIQGERFGGGGKGGGFFFYQCSLTITNCTISNNSADDDGGGIYMQKSTATIINSTISNNKALDDLSAGGGIYCNDSPVTITNSTFSGNSAIYGAGCNFYNNSPATITNTVFTDNRMTTGDGRRQSHGGAIETSRSPLTVTNSTITGNSADYGGSFYIVGSPTTITNSIIWNNTAYGEYATGNEIRLRAYAEDFTSLDLFYSIIDPAEISSNGDGYISSNVAPNCINADPLLADDNVHLLPESPCIDAGTSEGAPADDIDGDERPIGDGIDIGSDEAY